MTRPGTANWFTPEEYLMADDSKSPPPEPAVAGMAGAALAAANFANRLTIEKLLAVTVVTILGFVVYYGQVGVTEREAGMARRYDESREQDRRHCDDREDRAKQERSQEAKDLRAWFASQSDAQRRHDAERDEKMARAFAERDEKVRGILAMILSRLEALKP